MLRLSEPCVTVGPATSDCWIHDCCLHIACFPGEVIDYCLPLQSWGAAHLRAPGRPGGLWPMTSTQIFLFLFVRELRPQTKRVFEFRSMALPYACAPLIVSLIKSITSKNSTIMKKIENTFAVSGFVGRDAEIRQFANTSVARFSLAVGRTEKSGDESTRISAFMNIEAWRKNENSCLKFSRTTSAVPSVLRLHP